MKQSLFLWTIKILAAVILLQTLYFKFSGAAESVYIFTRLGMEPYGRIGSGIAELLASILILVPRTAWSGALLGFVIMGGAILIHLLFLGIEVKNDGGTLFILAIIAFLCCLMVLYDQKGRFKSYSSAKHHKTNR